MALIGERTKIEVELRHDEYAWLSRLCLALGMSENTTMRHALIAYQSMHARIAQGQRMVWLDKDGNDVDRPKKAEIPPIPDEL